MTEQPSGQREIGDSWEQRATEFAGGVQRWLIRASARTMRDELGDQVRRAIRGEQRDAGDIWATATTEPPDAANEPPECAWCPICRAARRVAESRAEAGTGGSVLTDAADVVSGAVRDVLATFDSILSYRPGEGSAGASSDDSSPAATPHPAGGADDTREPSDEPDDRS